MKLETVLTIIAASTPNGRWTMFQAWLGKNPKWRKKIDFLSTQTSDVVMGELELWAIEEYGPASIALVNDSLRGKIKAAIENLQSRYNARLAETQPEKEIKNVSDGKNNRVSRKQRRRSSAA